MAKFKSKADTKFEEKLAFLLGPAREKPKPMPAMAISVEVAERARREQERPLPLDTDAVWELFFQYGTYLVLVDHEEKGEPVPAAVDNREE